MAESKQYLLPNTEGRYVTVPVTETNGAVYRINDDGTRTIYADYFVEDGNTVLESSAFSSQEFQRNLAQNSQGYNTAISNSILQANGQVNSQPDPNQPGVAGGSTPTDPNPQQPQQSGSGNLKYPEDMDTQEQDFILFTAVEYIPPGLGETGSVAGQRQNPKRSTKGTVTLPIQAQISDGNAVGWEAGGLDEITRRALDTSVGLIKGGKSGEEVGLDFQKTILDFKANESQTLALLAEKVIGLNNLQGRTGGILNPNIELLFTGPGLRDFNFNIKMTPRSGTESEQVKSIIRFFKENMAPKRQDGNLFLKAPNTFLIKYQGRGEQGLNKIKECALVNCSVNYTPQGSYMTYEDGTMVSYFMQLLFKEIEPLYDVNYKGLPANSIGY
jgi:hypothetical protein